MLSGYTELIDLTLPLVSHMPVAPGNRKMMPDVEFRLYRDAREHGIQVGFLQTGIHAGTHLDAPRHILPGGETIDQLPLTRFLGPGWCIDCSEVGANEPVTAAMLQKAAAHIAPGMTVLLHTGWSDRYFFDGTDTYWADAPFLGEDAAHWLVDHGVKIAGYDFFQDAGAKRDVIDPSLFRVHKILLGADCLNIEHLTHLGRLLDRPFDLLALPLNLPGAEGAPARVVALR